MPKANLHDPITHLNGVGPATEEKLAKLGITKLQDLLFHFPFRYQDRTRTRPIGSLRAGDESLIKGEVVLSDVVRGRRRSLVCRIQDGTGLISMRLFHFSKTQQTNLKPGTPIRCFGEVRHGPTGLELFHPEYKLGTNTQQDEEAYLTPVYPATERLSQNKIRELVRQTLATLDNDGQQHTALIIPEDLLPKQLTSTKTSFATIHFLHQPPAKELTDQDIYALNAGEHSAQQALIFEELVAHQLSLLQLRHRVQKQPAPSMATSGRLADGLLSQLAFTLTSAQQKVVEEINNDLVKPFPMLRLVQGDVGSGKTIVAALAALKAIEAGYQVALMAPTEILAEQHLYNFRNWLEPLYITPYWLTGKMKASERKQATEAMASGVAQLAVGTHALFQADVSFKKLGLVIIDEQHRFGVHQRLSLRNKGKAGTGVPHQLIMTATPIPRTLAMTAYADLDVSIIDELPPGRLPVETLAVNQERRQEVIERVRKACQQGSQVYWVCTLIAESEALDCQAAEDTAELLRAALPELSVGLIHGRLNNQDKQNIMEGFKSGQIQLLVATTVIEVGVDVPQANLIIIENPERLGLAQLHQLRGRVGRGSAQSYCVLLYSTPLSEQGKKRIAVMRDTQDGFKVAEQDLQMRGPGELLGTRQAGIVDFKLANLERDSGLLDSVKACTPQFYAKYPDQVSSLIKRWLGHKEQYGEA